VKPRTGSSFARTLTVTDVTNNVVLGTVSASGTQPATMAVQAVQGQKFLILVSGTGVGEEGEYTLEVCGLPVSDDHNDERFFDGATEIDENLYDFDKTETVSGRINTPGDTDTFSFNALTFDIATITVQSSTGGFAPSV